MVSDEAAGIIDLYQRKAAHWIESRARTRLIEKAWLDRLQVLLRRPAQSSISAAVPACRWRPISLASAIP